MPKKREVTKMARRRMISNDITGSYNFQSMEHTTQLLYFYFCLSADDDGFIGNPYIYTNLTGCSENDLETLERRGYVIRFASGVLAVVHWYIHNTIKKDRYNPTVHKAELAQLRLEDKCYVRAPQPETERNQNGTKTEPQYSQVKYSQVESSQVESSQAELSQVESSQAESNQAESNQNASGQTEAEQEKIIPFRDRTVKRPVFPLRCYDYLSSFNTICSSLPPEEELTEGLSQALTYAERLIAPKRLEEVFRMAAESDFLSGRSGVWRGCSLTWILKPDNLRKILSGKYRNRGKPKRQTLVEQFDLDEIDTLDFMNGA
ncbi:MAG: hypothetical protein II074_02955 [Ruminococcus sp.]|nr:hypothetical protein [Ruminococcus sp.]MBQ1686419.1 hypothetical protein [Ruminococcus sp.]